MATDYHYVPCREEDVPDNVRFDVPARHGGHTVEVAYGGFSRAAHDAGDPYKRVHDRSIGGTTYYRLVKE
jgi:hypothetical protein